MKDVLTSWLFWFCILLGSCFVLGIFVSGLVGGILLIATMVYFIVWMVVGTIKELKEKK